MPLSAQDSGPILVAGMVRNLRFHVRIAGSSSTGETFPSLTTTFHVFPASLFYKPLLKALAKGIDHPDIKPNFQNRV